MRLRRLFTLLGCALVCAGLLATSASARPTRRPGWLTSVLLTQYWPAPEAWFHGAFVQAPGLPGLHRIDWLYSAHGLSMEGDGIGMDGRMYHIDALGRGGWVSSSGRSTSVSGGSPFWRAGGYWRNTRGAVTYPLDTGRWSAGTGRRYVPLPGVSFAPGVPLPLTFWESVAVDPRLIAEGSRIYIPAYRNSPAHGWFLAQDTGGAIRGHHIDVYRSPPQSPLDPGQTVGGQPVYVLPPGQSLPAVAASERMPPPPGTPIAVHTTRRPKHRPAPTPKASVPPAAPTVPASVTGATYMPALPGDGLGGGAAAP